MIDNCPGEQCSPAFLFFSPPSSSNLSKSGFLPCARKFLIELRKWKILKGSGKKHFLDSTSRDVGIQNLEIYIKARTLQREVFPFLPWIQAYTAPFMFWEALLQRSSKLEESPFYIEGLGFSKV